MEGSFNQLITHHTDREYFTLKAAGHKTDIPLLLSESSQREAKEVVSAAKFGLYIPSLTRFQCLVVCWWRRTATLIWRWCRCRPRCRARSARCLLRCRARVVTVVVGVVVVETAPTCSMTSPSDS